MKEYNWKIVLQSNEPLHKNVIGQYKASTISQVIDWCRKIADYHIRSITRMPLT